MMRGLLLAAFLFSAAYGIEENPPVPQWPSAATFEFTVTELTEEYELHVKTYYSAKNRVYRFDTWGGMNQVFGHPDTGEGYYYFPTLVNGSSKVACATFNFSSPIVSPFPDLNDYTFAGNDSLYGVPSAKWVFERRDRVSTVWIQQESNPGSNGPFLAAADSVSYVEGIALKEELRHSKIRYYNYIPGEPDPNVWSRPQMNCDYSDVISILRNHAIGDLVGANYLHLGSEAGVSVSQTREDIYEVNRKLVETHNQGPSGYKLELNHFAHLTKEEMASYKGLRAVRSIDKSSPFPYTDEQVEEMAKHLPESWDWRVHGAVTKVKDQRMCGSCWAFGTIGGLEGANFLKTGELVELSEQFLMDCTWSDSNNGCLGGCEAAALDKIMELGGVMGETQYGEYLAENGRCHLDKKSLISPIKGYTQVKNTTEAMKVALVNHGPIIVGIATPDDMMQYKNGVYKPSTWSESDHTVLLVGYGVLNNDSYWMIKNSWSKNWGLDGYGLISAENNSLKLLDQAYYINM